MYNTVGNHKCPAILKVEISPYQCKYSPISTGKQKDKMIDKIQTTFLFQAKERSVKDLLLLLASAITKLASE